MSAKKEELPADYIGEGAMPQSIQLLRLMNENKIKEIYVSYSGSGDSGCIDPPQITKPKGLEDKIDMSEMNELTFAIIEKIIDPNFDGSGSHGEVKFRLVKGVLKFHCEHHDVIETTDDSTVKKDLVSNSEFL